MNLSKFILVAISMALITAHAADERNLKYAGAIIYEVGTTTKAFDSQNLKPISKIYVCIDRSGNLNSGKVDIDFAKLGVPPFKSTATAGGKVVSEMDLQSLTLNYELQGEIKSYEKLSWGRIQFEAHASDEQWKQIQGKENRFQKEFATKPFDLKIAPSVLASAGVTYYDVDGVTYYIGASTLRFVKNSDGLQAVSECEKQDKTIIIKTNPK